MLNLIGSVISYNSNERITPIKLKFLFSILTIFSAGLEEEVACASRNHPLTLLLIIFDRILPRTLI